MLVQMNDSVVLQGKLLKKEKNNLAKMEAKQINPSDYKTEEKQPILDDKKDFTTQTTLEKKEGLQQALIEKGFTVSIKNSLEDKTFSKASGIEALKNLLNS